MHVRKPGIARCKPYADARNRRNARHHREQLRAPPVEGDCSDERDRKREPAGATERVIERRPERDDERSGNAAQPETTPTRGKSKREQYAHHQVCRKAVTKTQRMPKPTNCAR